MLHPFVDFVHDFGHDFVSLHVNAELIVPTGKCRFLRKTRCDQWTKWYKSFKFLKNMSVGNFYPIFPTIVAKRRIPKRTLTAVRTNSTLDWGPGLRLSPVVIVIATQYTHRRYLKDTVKKSMAWSRVWMVNQGMSRRDQGSFPVLATFEIVYLSFLQ